MANTLHSGTPNRKIGPIFIDQRGGKSPQIAVRFDMETMEQIRDMARSENKAISFIIRNLVLRAIRAR